jgi:hypothetical protein
VNAPPGPDVHRLFRSRSVPRWDTVFYVVAALFMALMAAQAFLAQRVLPGVLLLLLTLWFALRGLTFHLARRDGVHAVPAGLRWGQRVVLLAAVLLLVAHLVA